MLEDAGFDISDQDYTPSDILSSLSTVLSDKLRKHIQQCSSCHKASTVADASPLLRGEIGSPSLNSVCPTGRSTPANSPNLDLTLHETSADNLPHLVTLSVGGMTCSSCSGTITEMVSQLPGISDVVVSLLSNSATVVVARRDLVTSVTETITDCGFEVDVIKVEPLVPSSSQTSLTTTGPRNLLIRVDGMYCQYVDIIFAILSLIHIH